jgi:primosomal protein N' (replication factor Y)
MRYAKVVVNTRVQPRKIARGELRGEEADEAHATQTFHYSIPPELGEHVRLGQLVVVPFGPRRLQGVIFGFDDRSPVAETKELYEIADLAPVLSTDQVELASWISGYYLAPLIDVVLLMLPPGVARKTQIMLRLREESALPADLDGRERGIVELLRQEGEVGLNVLGRRLGPGDYRSVVDGLVRRGLIVKRSRLAEPKVKPKTERVARLRGELTPEIRDGLKRAPVQRSIVEYLDEGGPAAVSDIYAEVGGSSSTLRALVDKGLVELEEQEVWRDPLQGRTFVPSAPLKLTSAQDAAWRQIAGSLGKEGSEVFLLHGVTGSGKT